MHKHTPTKNDDYNPLKSITQFRFVTLGVFAYDLGWFIQTATISWILFDLTSSPIWAGAGAATQALPSILFAFTGGVFADRFSRIRILTSALSFCAILVFTLAFLDNAIVVRPFIYLLFIAAIGAGAAFLWPSILSLVVDMVSENQLPRANGIISFVRTTGQFLGPLIAGAVIASFGTNEMLWIISGLYAVSAFVMSRMNDPKKNFKRVPTNMKTNIKEILIFIKVTKPMPLLVAILMLQNLLGMTIFPLMPIYARDVLGVGAAGFGIMGAIFGLGLIGSATLVSIFGIHKKRMRVILITTVIWDLGMIGFGFSRNFYVTLVILFLMGLGGSIWVNAVLLIFQTVSRSHLRGRVIGIYVLIMECGPIGWVIGGTVAAFAGNQNALIFSAICGTPILLLVMVFSPRLRNL